MATAANAAVVLGSRAAPLDGPWTQLAVEDAPRTTGEPLGRRARPHHLVYTLFTSGSTGRPKGVLVEHRGLVDYVTGFLHASGLPPETSYATVTTFAGDVGNTAIFPALCGGGTLHLIAWDRATSPVRLAEYFARHRVDVLKAVPSLAAAHLEAEGAAVLPRRRLVLGGEALSWSLADRVAELAADTLLNHYGPTETTVGSVMSAPDAARRGATVPLGRPLPNQRTYVLDPWGHLSPDGVEGELYIGGAGVTRGYAGRPDLTADRFVPDPFAAAPGARMYRTGDRVRRLPGGAIEFLGRVDAQIKVRGFRVEPGEIEAALRAQPGVADAAVLLRDDLPGGPRLVAYVVGALPDPAALSATLPDYMIPAAFVALDAFPLTANGKLDRRALPAPDIASTAGYVAPRDEVEAMLAQLWAELLGVERVGVRDDFFALGGHSLLAVRLLAKLQHVLGVRVSLRALFEAPTIEALAMRVAAGRGEAPDDARPAVRRSPVRRAPVLAPQRGSYFVSNAGQRNALRLGRSMWLDGDLDVDALARAFDALRARHEILRTRYVEQDGQVWQEVLDEVDVVLLQRADLSAVPAEAQARRADELHAQVFQQPYDLARGEVVRALLVRFSPTRHRLSFAVHHISSDMQTLQIFDDELCALWRAFATGASAETVLPPPPAHYLDLVDYLGRLASTAEGARQRAFWDRQLAGATPLALPIDLPRAPVDDARRAAPGGIVGAIAGVAGSTLGPEAAAAAQRIARAENTTVMTVLLAALATQLTELTGQHDLALTSPLQYRHLPGFERSLGFFANPLVMRVSTAGAPTFAELVARTSVAVAEAYDHGDEDLLARAPTLFRVLFNFHYTHAVIGANAAPDLPAMPAGVARSAAPFPAHVDRVQGYDLIVHVAAYDDAIHVGLNYLTELFRPDAAASLLDRYLATIRRVLGLAPA
jgi:amino acid adenylation domain-containing protein